MPWKECSVMDERVRFVARPEGLEPPTLCFEDTQYKTLSAAAGVAYEGARHLSRP
jgi:hypothetical protein